MVDRIGNAVLPVDRIGGTLAYSAKTMVGGHRYDADRLDVSMGYYKDLGARPRCPCHPNDLCHAIARNLGYLRFWNRSGTAESTSSRAAIACEIMANLWPMAPGRRSVDHYLVVYIPASHSLLAICGDDHILAKFIGSVRSSVASRLDYLSS